MATLHESPAAIMITDAKGTIGYVNPAFETQLGYQAGEILGQTTDVLKNGPQADSGYAGIEEQLAATGRWSGRIVYRRKDGSHDTRDIMMWALHDDHGTLLGHMAAARPASRDPHIETQLLHNQKMEAIGELASGIAHEINTPTQYIGDNLRFFKESFADLRALLEDYEQLLEAAGAFDPLQDQAAAITKKRTDIDLEYLLEEIPTAIDQALDGNARVAEIVRAMKAFAHPGSDTMTPVNLNRAIESAIQVARNEWKYVARVDTQFDETLPEISCLPGSFNQVVLNLIVNASHAIEAALKQRSETQGVITISTARTGDWVELRVTDTGTGIPKSVGNRVFEPFFTTKEVGKGTGQGLASAHFIITEKHHGTISMESKEGSGATFIVRLPIQPPDPDPVQSA